jgi:hypothetical protein
MKVLFALRMGMGITLRKFGIVILLLIINVIFAFVLSVPMFFTLQHSFGDSIVRDNMLDGFDTLWYGEFQYEIKGVASSFNPSIIGIGAFLSNFTNIESGKLFQNLLSPISILMILYLIFGTFLNGGILGTFNQPEKKFSFINFFKDCSKYFFRFLLIMICAVACYVVLYKYFFPWLGNIFNKWGENATVEKIPFLFDRIRNFISLVIICFIGIVFDYTKIITVVEQKRNIIMSFVKSLIFIFLYITKSFSLYIVLMIIGIVFIIFYAVSESLFTQNTLQNIWIVFGIQQTYILLKLWLKCTFFSSQMTLYKWITIESSNKQVEEHIIKKG